MQNSFKTSLETNLKEAGNPGEFWQVYFEFLEERIRFYFADLKKMGLNSSLLTTVSKNNLEDSTPERIRQVKDTVTALSQLHALFHSKEEQLGSLQKRLSELEGNAQKREQNDQGKAEVLQLQQELESAMQLLEAKEKQLELVPKRLTGELAGKLQLTRDRVRMIGEFTSQITEQTPEGLENLHNHIGNALKTIVDQLSDCGLWPEEESKPLPQEAAARPAVLGKKGRTKKKTEEGINKELVPSKGQMDLEAVGTRENGQEHGQTGIEEE